jgi:hypothetical protein
MEASFMRSKLTINLIWILCVINALFICGCGEPTSGIGEEGGIISGGITTYQFTSESDQYVDWQGKIPDSDKFKKATNDSDVRFVFTREYLEADDQGDIVSKIVIKELKIYATVKDRAILDFDSTREKDQSHTLSKLIGKSYTVVRSAENGIIKAVNARDVQSRTSIYTPAKDFFSTERITERQNIMIMPQDVRKKIKKNYKWSSVKDFEFGKMGSRSFERQYSVKEIKQDYGQKTAVIEMTAIPSFVTKDGSEAEDFSGGFDYQYDYTGEILFDMTSGEAAKNAETLDIKWVMALPASSDSNELVTLIMGAKREYAIEIIE